MPFVSMPEVAYRNFPEGCIASPPIVAFTGGVKGDPGTGASAPVLESTENAERLCRRKLPPEASMFSVYKNCPEGCTRTIKVAWSAGNGEPATTLNVPAVLSTASAPIPCDTPPPNEELAKYRNFPLGIRCKSPGPKG